MKTQTQKRIPLCDICNEEAPNIIPCFSTEVLCDSCLEKVDQGLISHPPRTKTVKWKEVQPLQPLQQNLIILKNEQPVQGCKDCGILWYQLVDYRNKWRMRPTEFCWQDLFDGAQDAYLDHYREQHQAGVHADE